MMMEIRNESSIIGLTAFLFLLKLKLAITYFHKIIIAAARTCHLWANNLRYIACMKRETHVMQRTNNESPFEIPPFKMDASYLELAAFFLFPESS